MKRNNSTSACVLSSLEKSDLEKRNSTVSADAIIRADTHIRLITLIASVMRSATRPCSTYPRPYNYSKCSMCPRTEEREGNGNFGLVKIKGATKPRERERRGTMALQSCTMWLPRREPHHPRTSRCTFDPSIRRACRDLLRYPQCPKRSTGFQRSRKTRV